MNRLLVPSLLANVLLLAMACAQGDGSSAPGAEQSGQARTPVLTREQAEILSHFSIEYLPAGDYCKDAEGVENPCDPPESIAKTIRITGVNLQVVNGSGETGALNGLGNVIVGYHGERTFAGENCWDSNLNHRGGSHNLIVGDRNNYKAHSSIVAGFGSSSWEEGATALGANNIAAGTGSLAAGGTENWAFGRYAAVVGGAQNVVFDDEKGFLAGRGQSAGFEPCGGGE